MAGCAGTSSEVPVRIPVRQPCAIRHPSCLAAEGVDSSLDTDHHIMTTLHDCKTLGITSFARCGDGSHTLFLVNSNVPADVALEYAAMLQASVNQALLEAVEGDSGTALLWPALYLGEMAKAVIDDLAEGAMATG